MTTLPDKIFAYPLYHFLTFINSQSGDEIVGMSTVVYFLMSFFAIITFKWIPSARFARSFH